jgi:hypothetical protein
MEVTGNIGRLILCVLIFSLAAGILFACHCHMIGYYIGRLSLRDNVLHQDNAEYHAPGGFFDAPFIAFE